MTLAEKLTLIAQNEQKVYSAGYEKGKSEGGGGGEQPTLFAPSIELNSVSSVLTITDDRNGDFAVLYDLYAGGEFVTTLSSKTATLTDYMEHTETIEVKVRAKSTNFNPSDYAVKEWTKISVDGTVGLMYEMSSNGTYATCTGIGTATDTEIEIASEYDGVPVTAIGEYAFDGCKTITSVAIPSNVTSINFGAFWGCDGLTSITIPDSVTKIDNYAVARCSNLTLAVIGNGVTSIGDYAFQDCSKLKRVDFSNHTSVPKLGFVVFGGTHSTLQIKAPANLIDEWKNATNWANYASKLVTEFTNEV